MTRVTVNEALRSMLHNLSQPLELCDESGRVLGRVFPALDLSEYEPWEPPISEEELRRREQSTEKRYTTAEVLAHLENL
ncbi:MAG TPA: hypothetical protein VG013_38065 [Gemmataceae bacterium]|nr:hypothetical protein [Gemmataceae bacterium]